MDAEIKVVAFDVDGTLYGHGAYLWRMALSGLPDLPLAYAYNRARTLYREEQGGDLSLLPTEKDICGVLPC